MSIATSQQALSEYHPDSLRELTNLFKRPSEYSLELPNGVERQALPIDPYLPHIAALLKDHPVVIVAAATGAGKSTGVPKYFIQNTDHDLLVTQPRRLAARSVATRVAHELGESLGETIGYRTAVDGIDSQWTRCLYLTDGLALVSELSAKKPGEKPILIIDEAHEANTNIEMLQAYVRRESKLNPERRFIIMSATMDTKRLSQYHGGAPIVEVPGRTHVITVAEAGNSIVGDAVKFARDGKNVLVFLEGKREIEEAIQTAERTDVDAEMIPLHADLLPQEQDLCFRDYGRPKIIFATNVAQTSITIADIDVVIDCGMERQARYREGVEILAYNPISFADEAQRKGRAGRTHEGIYVSHCPVSRTRRRAFPVPEIERTSLDQVALRFAAQGLDIEKLTLFHQPNRPEIQEAKELLKTLGCFDKSGAITNLGEQVAKLPVSARVGKMLYEGQARGVLEDMITAAVIIEGKGIQAFSSDGPPAGNEDSDLIAQSDLFHLGCRLLRDSSRDPLLVRNRLENHGISPRSFIKALEAYNHLADICRREFGSVTTTGSKKALLTAVVASNLDRIWVGNDEAEKFNHVSDLGKRATRFIGRDSSLSFFDGEPALLVGQPFDLEIKTAKGPKMINTLTMNTRVSLDMLKELALDRIQVSSQTKRASFAAAPLQVTQLWLDDCSIHTGELPEKFLAGIPQRP
jgi:HrpA-like RNA helicase